MYIARFDHSLVVTLSEEDYIFTHRRFANGAAERLKLTVNVVGESRNILELRIVIPDKNAGPSPHASPFKMSGETTLTAILNARDHACLTHIPAFRSSRFPLQFDNEGVQRITLPHNLMNKTSPAVGSTIVLREKEELEAKPVVSEQDELLERMREAAGVINAGIAAGYTPRYDEDGRIVRISIPDVSIT